jgi:hypothetical protein
LDGEGQQGGMGHVGQIRIFLEESQSRHTFRLSNFVIGGYAYLFSAQYECGVIKNTGLIRTAMLLF